MKLLAALLLPLRNFVTALIVASALAQPAVWAQTSPALAADPILTSATQAAAAIDEGRIDALWLNAPAFVKAKVSQSRFVDGVRKERGRFGSVTKREWTAVSRFRYEEGSIDPPAGWYATVEFFTVLPDGAGRTEQLSMRLEPSGWVLIGYVSPDSKK